MAPPSRLSKGAEMAGWIWLHTRALADALGHTRSVIRCAHDRRFRVRRAFPLSFAALMIAVHRRHRCSAFQPSASHLRGLPLCRSHAHDRRFGRPHVTLPFPRGSATSASLMFPVPHQSTNGSMSRIPLPQAQKERQGRGTFRKYAEVRARDMGTAGNEERCHMTRAYRLHVPPPRHAGNKVRPGAGHSASTTRGPAREPGAAGNKERCPGRPRAGRNAAEFKVGRRHRSASIYLRETPAGEFTQVQGRPRPDGTAGRSTAPAAPAVAIYLRGTLITGVHGRARLAGPAGGAPYYPHPQPRHPCPLICLIYTYLIYLRENTQRSK